MSAIEAVDRALRVEGMPADAILRQRCWTPAAPP
jgi:hypothetical protein